MLLKFISHISFYVFVCGSQKTLNYTHGSHYISVGQHWSRPFIPSTVFVFQVFLFASSLPWNTITTTTTNKTPSSKVHTIQLCYLLPSLLWLSTDLWAALPHSLRILHLAHSQFFLMIFLYSSLFPSDFNVHVDNSSNTLAPGPDQRISSSTLPQPFIPIVMHYLYQYQ